MGTTFIHCSQKPLSDSKLFHLVGSFLRGITLKAKTFGHPNFIASSPCKTFPILYHRNACDCWHRTSLNGNAYCRQLPWTSSTLPSFYWTRLSTHGSKSAFWERSQ